MEPPVQIQYPKGIKFLEKMPEITQPLFPLNRRVFFSVFHDTPLCKISQKSQNCFKHLNSGDGGGNVFFGLAWKWLVYM